MTKQSKLLFSFFFASLSQFAVICRDLYYVLTTVALHPRLGGSHAADEAVLFMESLIFFTEAMISSNLGAVPKIMGMVFA